MNTHYKVKLTPHPLIIRVHDETEEIIFGNEKYIPVKKAERIVKQLNNGEIINWDELN